MTAWDIQRMGDTEIIGFHRDIPPFRAKRGNYLNFPNILRRPKIAPPQVKPLPDVGSRPRSWTWAEVFIQFLRFRVMLGVRRAAVTPRCRLLWTTRGTLHRSVRLMYRVSTALCVRSVHTLLGIRPFRPTLPVARRAPCCLAVLGYWRLLEGRGP